MDCPLHPRFSTFLAYLVFFWCVTEVLCAVTDQVPRILLDFLCTSGVVADFEWLHVDLSRVARRPRHVGAVSWRRLFLGPVHRHRAGGACPQGHGPPQLGAPTSGYGQTRSLSYTAHMIRHMRNAHSPHHHHHTHHHHHHHTPPHSYEMLH